MARLRETTWLTKYHADIGSLVQQFYEPALGCAVRYDRTSGYFTASSLTIAARGIDALVKNEGKMRLIVGCTLSPPEVEAIQNGLALRSALEANLLDQQLKPLDEVEADALELLAWMIARGSLDVRVAVPCDVRRRPVAQAIFHEKAGIIQDATGDRLAFNGSINETLTAWGSGGSGNWESFHVFTAFDATNPHVEDEEATFARLWANKAEHALVLDVPIAVREGLLQNLPQGNALPRRLLAAKAETKTLEPQVALPQKEPLALPKDAAPLPIDVDELRRQVWAIIREAPAWPDGGEWIGEATSAVEPWPHQVRAFKRMYEPWPPKLLIADEVGLGKTIEAGLVLRQAWLAGRAKRILVLTPRAVLKQWQIELRDKFNLNWPIYDGQTLHWYPARARHGDAVRLVGRTEWHKEPFVLASSHLMRRSDRAADLLAAEPWDLVVLDEAHHARRRGGGTGKEMRPNQLLRLMIQLKEKTQGLLLLTATPMQVHPIEVWDLLALLGLPKGWTAETFVQFFAKIGRTTPSHEDFEFLAKMFREVENHFGRVADDAAVRWLDGSKLASKKMIEALRDKAQAPRRQLATDRRKAALALIKTTTPVAKLISRHTRELLRQYQAAGKLTSRIAERDVHDEFVKMTPDERKVYEQVEAYISSTYNNASPDEQNAVGFVMTIYRRRLASSFAALRNTLEDRLKAVQRDPRSIRDRSDRADDVSDDEATDDDVMDLDDAASLEQRSLAAEEAAEIQALLRAVKGLPTDTKAKKLLDWIKMLLTGGYPQVIVFTQYTDTMDFLRDFLRKNGISVMCYSGRGGEVVEASGNWKVTTREDIKRRFRDRKAEVLVATDAAAEGLNFQFCGSLINFDMPWNPMRVEQRIGRIDRLGQAFEKIRIVNLHYDDTVETDVYHALRQRIGLFSKVVGKLQPILAALPKQIADVALAKSKDKAKERADLVQELETQIRDRQGDAFDLDEIAKGDLELPPRPAPPYDLPALDLLLVKTDLLPNGVEVKRLDKREYELSMPGMQEPLRITTSKDRFEDNPGSYELWSPGSPLFPAPDSVPTPTNPVEHVALRKVMARVPTA